MEWLDKESISRTILLGAAGSLVALGAVWLATLMTKKLLKPAGGVVLELWHLPKRTADNIGRKKEQPWLITALCTYVVIGLLWGIGFTTQGIILAVGGLLGRYFGEGHALVMLGVGAGFTTIGAVIALYFTSLFAGLLTGLLRRDGESESSSAK